jgi:hypothetical protein
MRHAGVEEQPGEFLRATQSFLSVALLLPVTGPLEIIPCPAPALVSSATSSQAF